MVDIDGLEERQSQEKPKRRRRQTNTEREVAPNLDESQKEVWWNMCCAQLYKLL